MVMNLIKKKTPVVTHATPARAAAEIPQRVPDAGVQLNGYRTSQGGGDPLRARGITYEK